MKRCQIIALCDCLHDLVVYHNGGCELLTTVDHSVTYGINLVKGLDYSNGCIC